jgi:hypothetical protein
VSLAGQYANVTLDGVFVENMAYGDRQSGNQLSGLSLINTFNMWFFYWDRCAMAMQRENTCTMPITPSFDQSCMLLHVDLLNKCVLAAMVPV